MTDRDKQGLKDYCDSVRRDINEGKDLHFHLTRLQTSIRGLDDFRARVDPDNKHSEDYKYTRNEYYRLIWEIKECMPPIQRAAAKMSPEEEEIRRGENLEKHLQDFTERLEDVNATIKSARDFGFEVHARGFEELKEEYYRLIYLIKEQL